MYFYLSLHISYNEFPFIANSKSIFFYSNTPNIDYYIYLFNYFRSSFLLSLFVHFHISYSFSTSEYTSILFESIILHYLATATAVKVLSPVAIIVLISQSFNIFIVSIDYFFSWFSNIKNPRKFKSFSKNSLSFLKSSFSFIIIFLAARAITLSPLFVYLLST